MEGTEDSYYFSDGAESIDSYDKEQLEIALYSRIHFANNFDHTKDTDTAKESANDNFDICVEGNEHTGYKASETNADYILNKDVEKKYDSVVIDTQYIKKNNAAMLIKNVVNERTHKSRQVSNEVKKSKHIQSLLRKDDLGKKFSAATLGDSGIQLDDSKEDMIYIDDSNDSTIYIDATTSGSESGSDNQDILLGASSSDCIDDADIKMNVFTPRYTYTKMTGESHLDNNSESDDTEHWSINEEDKFKDKGVTVHGRYYKPVRCHNCNEVGHLSRNCPKPKKVIVCALCAEEGHICRNCPHSFCHNCETPGHESKFCPAPRRKWNRTCYRCNMPGHDEKSCPEIWRQYHVTVNRGKIRKFSLRRKRKIASCYNCGEQGHYGHECEDDRMNRFLMVNSPFITRYQNVREFCDVMNSARSDEMIDQSEEMSNDATWRSFDNIGEHVRVLRESKGKLHYKSGSGEKADKETKKPSQYLHMVKKTGKLRTGRNNFDKMLFTIQNEHSREISNSNVGAKMDKKGKTSKGERKMDGQFSKTVQTFEDKSHVKNRKRKIYWGNDDNSMSSSKLGKEDLTRNIQSETTIMKAKQAGGSKRRQKCDTFSTSEKESEMSTFEQRKPKHFTGVKGDDIKKKSNMSKFTADELFSLWSIDSSDSRNRDAKRDEPMVKISKKHRSHRNDNYAPDDLFSLHKIRKMQESGDVGEPVEEDDVDHQVFKNEWWNKSKKKRSRKRRNNQKY